MTAQSPDTLEKVARLLAQHPGYAFCEECLAHRLSLDPSVVWSAAVELGESEDFEVDIGICSHCLDRIEKVAHVRWLHGEDRPDAPKRPRIRFTALTTDDDEPGPEGSL